MTATNTLSAGSEATAGRVSNLRRTIGWSLVIVGVCCVVFLAYLAFALHTMVSETVPDMYGEWHAANMIIAYMGEHEDHWPKGWEDLKPYSGRQAGWWTFEELQGRVRIDFRADVNSLKSASVDSDGLVAFHVVELTSGKRAYYEGAEPNQLIWEYLQRHVAPPLPGKVEVP